jgi:hypothetical protein
MSLFKNLFGKKEEEEPKPFSRTALDLGMGYIFEYDLRTWEVTGEYEYDWGDEEFSKEYKVSDGKDSYYLAVEEDDEIELVWSSKIPVRQLGADIAKRISDGGAPPESLVYDNKSYHLDEESPGFFNDKTKGENDDWAEFIAWDYYNEDETLNLTLEQWGERSFEASWGKVIAEFEISDILPRK